MSSTSSGASGATPDTPQRPPTAPRVRTAAHTTPVFERRVATRVDLHLGINLGVIDIDATNKNITPADEIDRSVLPTSVNPPLTIIKYAGRKTTIGTNMILLTKTSDSTLVCLCWYTAVQDIGAEVV